MRLTKSPHIYLLQRTLLPRNTREVVRNSLIVWVVTGSLLFGFSYLNQSNGGDWALVVWLSDTISLVVIMTAGSAISILSRWLSPTKISFSFIAYVLATVL